MAIGQAPIAPLERLARLSLTTDDAERLAGFYVQAFDCRRLSISRQAGADFERLMQVQGGARSVLLGLGREQLELLQFDQRGRPYPQDASSSELIFQHFAIVVTDMAAALRRLTALPGWRAITTGGPQLLPQSSGGVTAFKFRDPEGHPLELLAFPTTAVPSPWRELVAQGPCVGVDHSALCVADTARSLAFYETLGLSRCGSSFNSGGEQSRLDALPDARVEVTALAPRQGTPHVELLCYRPSDGGQQQRQEPAALSLRSNDVAATRLIFAAGQSPQSLATPPQRRLVDPDGHHLLIG